MRALQKLYSTRPAMLDDLASLIAVESPSVDLSATAACAEMVAELGVRTTDARPERLLVDGRTHLRWHFGGGPPRVVLLGHLDTVWPLGTVSRWPFSVEAERATGPGVVDMKAGLVQLFYALSTMDDLDGVVVVVNSDEEVGSPTSQRLIEDTARGASAALVLEGSSGGALKVARKGIVHYRLRITGRAAHAGNAPHLGVNAGVELAHQVLAVAGLGNPAIGTTVTPTVCRAGTTSNTVPAMAWLDIDVRAAEAAELARVDAAIEALRPILPGVTLTVERGQSRNAMPASASAELFVLAARLAADLGLPALRGEAVGGGSDGNLTAGIGVRTLDGLGAIGGNAHAEGEWVDISAMPQRAALVAAMVTELRSAGGTP